MKVSRVLCVHTARGASQFLDGKPCRTLAEIGAVMPGSSVSRERVRQLEERALDKLGVGVDVR